MTNYDLAYGQLFKVPVPILREIAIDINLPQRNHERRSRAIALYIIRNHDRAIAQAPDASWMPPCFEEWLEEWMDANLPASLRSKEK